MGDDELEVLASGDNGMCPTDFLRCPDDLNTLGILCAKPCSELGLDDAYCPVAGELGQLDDGELLCDEFKAELPPDTSGGEWNIGGDLCDFRRVGDRGEVTGESPEDADLCRDVMLRLPATQTRELL